MDNRGLADVFAHAMQNAGVPEKEATASLINIASSDPILYRLFEAPVKDRAYLALHQAIIDSHFKNAKIILDKWPDLLFRPLPKNLVLESKRTWQRFYAEDFLVMTAKRRQLQMMEFLLPYYQAFQKEALIKEAFAAWKVYEIKKNGDNKEEIAIPPEYTLYAQSLIDIFAEEDFPNGIFAPLQLNEKTESATYSLFNILLPKQAIKLEDYLDTELFLLTLAKTYREEFYTLGSWDRRDAFCIRAIGLVQSTLIPESAAKCDHPNSPLNVKDGLPFYRASRESKLGLGFNHFCSKGQMIQRTLYAWNAISSIEMQIESLCLIKAADFQKLKQAVEKAEYKQAKPNSLSLK